MASKRRKVDAENRQFNAEWTVKYWVIEVAKKIICLVCRDTISVMKEYNVKRHYMTKHEEQYRQLTGQAKEDKLDSLKRAIERQQQIMMRPNQETKQVTEVGFMITHRIAKAGRIFGTIQ